METDPYLPMAVFWPGAGRGEPPPRVFLSPQRYIQGPGVLAHVGHYLSLLKARRAGVLATRRRRSAEGGTVIASLEASGIEAVIAQFGGECSLEEIGARAADLGGQGIDCLLAVGGGKCVDAGKAIAHRLEIPVVIIPTIASNDAPCSAVSVLYTPEGVSSGVEFFPSSPALVVVDSEAIARAPSRYLVAGIGDAMATWYEARLCMAKDTGITPAGGRPTLASMAIGEVCARTLFECGLDAVRAAERNVVEPALERVIEANVLLSGLGFESGGLAAAHGVAQSFTAIPKVHGNYLHGEMVAIGTLTQLVMEQRDDEAERVAEFFAAVGLPVHLGQIGLDDLSTSNLNTVIEGTLAFPFIGNMPMPVTAHGVRDGLLGAHEVGRRVTARRGEDAYRRIHTS